MPSERRRGARRTAAPLAASALTVAIALSGCSGSSSSPAATPSTPQSPTAGTPSSPAVSTEASRVITKAAGVMQRMRAYRFVADEQVIATTRLHSHLAGSLVRGQGLAYRVTVGSKTQEVVRLRSATYVRVVPHHWARLKHPKRLADPTATLQKILRGLRPSGLATSHGITAVHGTLTPAAARASGLPATRPVEVTVTIDPHGRVIAVDLRTTTRAAGHDVTVRLRTSYDRFDRVRPIRKPV